LQLRQQYSILRAKLNSRYSVMDDGARSHRLRTGRYSEPGHIYLITTVTQDRTPWFADLCKARCLVRALMEAQDYGSGDTLAYVVMPDHLHWLLALGDRCPLSTVVGTMKSLTGRRIGCRVWQTGFHDHALRREENVLSVARYVVANPLRAGLVKSLRDYPHWDAAWL
jgi:REP element-mobilizing transposase RayT